MSDFVTGLKQATEMFTAGVNQIHMQRTLRRASGMVQQVRDQEDLSDKDRDEQLRDIGTNLSFALTEAGVPASGIQTTLKTFFPPKDPLIQSIDQALIDDDPETRKQGREAYYTKKSIDAMFDAPPSNLPERRFEAQVLNRRNRAMERLQDKLDESAEVRSAFGREGQSINRVLAGEALLATLAAKDRGDLSPIEVRELATNVVMVLSNGQRTSDEQINAIDAKTWGIDFAKLKQYMTNGVESGNVKQFVDLYAKFLRRERNASESRISEFIERRMQGFLGLARQAPEDFKNLVISQFPEGSPLSPDDIIIQKHGITTRQAIERKDKLKQLRPALKEARRLFRKRDKTPKEQENLDAILTVLNFSESDLKVSSDQELMKSLVTRVRLGAL